MTTCSICGTVTPDGKTCAACGAPFTQHNELFPPPAAGFTSSPPPPPVKPQQSLYQGTHVNELFPPPSPPPGVATSTSAAQADGFVPMAVPVYPKEAARNPERVPSRMESFGSGLLKGRYKDHPNCDICGLAFDLPKPRHRCRRCGLYVCGACSPHKLLIPYGDQIENAKGYDVSTPQRVCLHCAPTLHPVQNELVAQYARMNDENHYEPKGKFHVPYASSLEKECQNAADIIGNFFRDDGGTSSDRGIPIGMLEKAHGLAIMTLVKAGFLVVGKAGTGLVISKLPNGSWSAPSAIGTVGIGGGLELGGEIAEVMIILGSPEAVQVFYNPQVNLGAGLDIAVGPYGRSAQAAAAVSSSGLNGNYSYSVSKGLFAGISLHGSVIATRNDLNRKFYGQDLEPSAILSGYIGQPPAARPLYVALDNAMKGIQQHKAVEAERARMMGVCRHCNCQMFVTHTTQIWNKKCKTCDHIH